MIEKLKELPVDEQVKILTDAGLLKKILYKCNSSEFLDLFRFYSREQSLEIFKTVELVFKSSIKNDSIFLNFFLKRHYNLILSDIITLKDLKTDDIEKIFGLVSTDKIQLLVSKLSSTQVQEFGNRISKRITSGLSKEQSQILKIYNQISSSSLKKVFGSFIKKNYNVSEISLDYFFNSGNYELVIELSKIENEIIKNDLSNEKIQILIIYSKIKSYYLKEDFKSYIRKNPNASEISLDYFFSSGNFELVIKLSKIENMVIKNDLSKEKIQILIIYNKIKSQYLKEKFKDYIMHNPEISEISLSVFFNFGDFELLLELSEMENEIIKSDLSNEIIQMLIIYSKIKSYYLKEDFKSYIRKNPNASEISLDYFFNSGNFELVIELSKIENMIIKNDLSQQQHHIMSKYIKIESKFLKSRFKEYLISHRNLSDDQIADIIIIFERITKSNSLEVRKLEVEIVDALLQLENPIDKFEQIEDVFLKNNLPAVGKVYKVFEIMHPNFKGFNFNKGLISPVLSSKSNYSREIIVFADLVRSFMGSNNRSMNNYLNNLEIGNKLFIGISEGRLCYEELSSEQIDVLHEFVSHLNTLFNNTQKGKVDNNKELTGNIIEDIRFLKTLFSVDGKLDYNLPDRIIKMYCHFAGIDTLEQAKQYIKRKVQEADSRGRIYAEGVFTLEEGDFVKGIGGIEYLGNILQNGSNSKEYLGSSAGSDRTPLDTDLCIVLENGAINKCISNTVTDGYGPIYFILKNRDNRFTITRRSPKEENKTIDTKMDLTKLEAFYTGAIGNGEHYGIRTGFASSEIDYIVVNSYDDRIGLEIAMNGFYIPVVDRQGKLIFSPDEYDKLRSKMNGLSYYEISSYNISDDLETPEILQMASKIDESEREVSIKRNAINETISKVIQKYGLKLKDHVDGDIQEGYVELIDTGSTGRGTNMPGNGDFDYMMRLDRSIMDNPDLLGKIKQNLLTVFGNVDSGVIGTGDFRLKDVKVEGLDVPVDIDITFVERTDKLAYSTDMCISDRLRNIRKQYPDKYSLVIANILEAKKIFKSAGCYKPDRGDNPQGGLGGVGVENWILQNGGSLKYAAMEFLEASESKSFEKFRQSYKVHDFGENHLAQKKGIYPHDNFVYNNMSRDGYEKMKECLKQYLMEYGKTDDIEKGKTL